MSFEQKPKRYRYPASIISYAVWKYHRFNLSFRDVQEQLAYRGIIVSHETVRKWCLKFSRQFKEVLQKRERQASDKWHLDERVFELMVSLLFYGELQMNTAWDWMFSYRNIAIKHLLSGS